MAQTLDELARTQFKKWIESTGLTQTELAARVGRNQAWMSRYLHGHFDADLETLQKMAKVFGSSLAQVLQVPSDPEEAALIAAYRALRYDSRKIALEMLQDWSRPRGRGRSRK
jgi:transcriptional regulator with XRE-family HTH domain